MPLPAPAGQGFVVPAARRVHGEGAAAVRGHETIAVRGLGGGKFSGRGLADPLVGGAFDRLRVLHGAAEHKAKVAAVRPLAAHAQHKA